MRALDLAEKFRAAFDADAAFNGVTCLNDLTAEAIVRPGLIFAVQTKALNDSGTALSFTLTVWIESPAEKRAEADPEPGAAHRTLTELVRTKLHGSGKAALLTALGTAGGYDWRGWSATESDPGLETHHFRTPVAASGTVLVV